MMKMHEHNANETSNNNLLLEPFIRVLKTTTDFSLYLEMLNAVKPYYTIILCVKDTPGTKMANNVLNDIHSFGFSKFSTQIHRMYIGIIDKSNIICDKIAEARKSPVEFSYCTDSGTPISVASKAFKNGNKAEVIINGYNCAVNLRGINIVVFDADNNKIIDSVRYDTHSDSNGVFTRNDFNVDFTHKNVKERQREIYEAITEKSVVLFGEGKNVKEFIEKYREKINIKCILTNKAEERIILPDGETITVQPYSKSKIEKDDFIVVCKADPSEDYREVKRILSNDGFIYGKDFLLSAIASAILDGRKIMTLLGYCQLQTIRGVLSKIEDVKCKFSTLFYRLEVETIKGSYRFEDFCSHIPLSDIVISHPVFAQERMADVDYEKLISDGAIKYIVPRLVFRGFYPYKDIQVNKHNLLSIARGVRPWPFRYEEPFLDKFILEDKYSNQEIYDIVMRDDFISEEEIRKNLKLSFKMIEFSDQNSDCKLLDYIKANYKERPLYHDHGHCQNCLYFEILRQLNRALNLCPEEDLNRLEKQYEDDEIFLFDYTEIPILPCVAKTLGITYATEDHLYRVKRQDGTISLITIKEWIFFYLDFTRSIYKIKQIFNLK